jgi:hypothetical protein
VNHEADISGRLVFHHAEIPRLLTHPCSVCI